MKAKIKKPLLAAIAAVLVCLFGVRVYAVNHAYPNAEVVMVPFGETVQAGYYEYTVKNAVWLPSYEEMLDYCSEDTESRAALAEDVPKRPYEAKWCIVEIEITNIDEKEHSFPPALNIEKRLGNDAWGNGSDPYLERFLYGERDFPRVIQPKETETAFFGYSFSYVPKQKLYEEWAGASLSDFYIPVQLYPAKICLALAGDSGGQ